MWCTPWCAVVGCAPTRGSRLHYGVRQRPLLATDGVLRAAHTWVRRPGLPVAEPPLSPFPSHRVLRTAPVMVVVDHVDVLLFLTLLRGGIWVGGTLTSMERTLTMEVLIAMLLKDHMKD